MKIKLVLSFALLTSIVGCGHCKRAAVTFTGNPTTYCYQGVTYLQFSSGAALAVDRDGAPIYCD